MSEKIVQTAGRDQLGNFAPLFAHLNDDVLFGEVWNESAVDVKMKCIITVVALMASGITDSSLSYHLQNAKAHGVTKEEIDAIITHVAMYVDGPKDGRYSAWQRRYGMIGRRKETGKTGTRILSFSLWASLMMPISSISRGRATWLPYRSARFPCIM